ncbi:MAG: hypothetical protein FK733_14010 [Asgard group archaeon]|nr:hypothetical protein [Asgard group archaeon]
MKNKMNKIIGFAILFALFFVKPMIQTESAVLIGTINSNASADPTIDGALTPSEWSDGDQKVFTLYELNNTGDTIQIQIMSLYSTNEIIYFGITVPDTNATNDYLLIAFRTNGSSPLILGSTPETMRFGNGNDMKIGFVHNNVTDDAYSLDYGPEIVFDTDDGGLNNIDGKCHTNSTHVTFEWGIPFNSGDTIGRDFNIWVGIQMNCFIYYFDDENDKRYSQLRKSESDYDYCQIHLITETPTAGIQLIIISLSTTSIGISTVLFKRRKN